MRYFEKMETPQLEKQANPLAWIIRGATLLGKSKGVTSMLGSKWFPTVSKYLGSQGTIESLGKSQLPGITENLGKLTSAVKQHAGAERFTNLRNTLKPGMQKAFDEAINPKNTLSNALQSTTPVKSTFKYIGRQFGIGDKPFQNIAQSYKGEGMFASKVNPGAIYQNSRLGGLTKKVGGRGVEAYFVGDSVLGGLEEGQSRSGKVFGNLGMFAGYRSTPRMFTGILRGGLLNTAGNKIGNTFGRKKITNPYDINPYRNMGSIN